MAADEKFIEALARMAFMERTLVVRQVASPAAATDFSIIVPGGRVWRPLAVTAQLVTDATVATRSTSLQVTDQTNTVVAIEAFANQAASLTELYSYSVGSVTGAGGAGNQVVTTALPDMALPAGYTIKSVTTNMGAADQWSKIVVWVEEIDAQPRGVYELRRETQELALDSGSIAAERNY